MPDPKVKPGVWGACKCGRTRWFGPPWEWQQKFCQWCGDELLPGGHVRPNLRRVVEQKLAEVLGRLADIPANAWHAWRRRLIVQGEADSLRRPLAVGCKLCKGTGYVTAEGAPDFPGDEHAVTQRQVPCPDCQPDGEKEDGEKEDETV